VLTPAHMPVLTPAPCRVCPSRRTSCLTTGRQHRHGHRTCWGSCSQSCRCHRRCCCRYVYPKWLQAAAVPGAAAAWVQVWGGGMFWGRHVLGDWGRAFFGGGSRGCASAGQRGPQQQQQQHPVPAAAAHTWHEPCEWTTAGAAAGWGLFGLCWGAAWVPCTPHAAAVARQRRLLCVGDCSVLARTQLTQPGRQLTDTSRAHAGEVKPLTRADAAAAQHLHVHPKTDSRKQCACRPVALKHHSGTCQRLAPLRCVRSLWL
jgi:hypothetical protein